MKANLCVATLAEEQEEETGEIKQGEETTIRNQVHFVSFLYATGV